MTLQKQRRLFTVMSAAVRYVFEEEALGPVRGAHDRFLAPHASYGYARDQFS